MNGFQSIQVTKQSKDKYYISIHWNGKRLRKYNGFAIGESDRPNTLPKSIREKGFHQLLQKFTKAIGLGWTPEQVWEFNKEESQFVSKHAMIAALEKKMSKGISKSYLTKLKSVALRAETFLDGKPPTAELLAKFLDGYNSSPSNYNNIRRHLLALESEFQMNNYSGSLKFLTKKIHAAEQLHKPIEDVASLLDEVQQFNQNLHLCCCLTYFCLLRPHREIRLLTWGDFSKNLNSVSLSGSRTKGRKNRIVPVNPIVQQILKSRIPLSHNPMDNIFTNNVKPFGDFYFTTLWNRFRLQSNTIGDGQTLYSFRHSGAIQVYEKTGSLTKLQQVMGHSSLQVSLTYLRGLEVRQLEQDDMPKII